MNLLYEKENGTDARRKRDAPQDDDMTNGKSGSNTKKKKKHATEDNRTIPPLYWSQCVHLAEPKNRKPCLYTTGVII
eukprot:scaffold92522_cov38-Attheya_sp.AAC.1